MDMRLELVPIPVADVDRSIAFYRDVIGFHLDHDVSPREGMRIVQLTPPGSACSIAFGTGFGLPTPDESVITGLHLVVDDVAAARDELVARGATVSGIDDMGGVLYAHFRDPDGNSWSLQEIRVGARP
jgi:catechol 2,3-dioxygenase-like lactoylglutathione lyase family enzyme